MYNNMHKYCRYQVKIEQLHLVCDLVVPAGLGHPVLDDPRRRALLHEPPVHGVRVLARGGGGHRLLGCNSGG